MYKMNSLELYKLLSKYDYTSPFFIGVYPANLLPQLNQFHNPYKLIIANIDDADGKGLHWVLFWFEENGRAYFFDSYGFHPHFYSEEF